MHIGALTVTLRVCEAASLKDKRHVLKSIVDGARRRFNVAIAEVDHLDAHELATLGIACVSNSNRHANSILDHVLSHLEANPQIIVEEAHLEIL
ncbi:MAG: DUF503 domain-containing protein [Chthonomonadales bacterium]